jgi:hypothetical protein
MTWKSIRSARTRGSSESFSSSFVGVFGFEHQEGFAVVGVLTQGVSTG